MPSFFVPARSSRHRQACFALYRSLLRLAPRVPLPADLTPSPSSPLGPANPIQALIRNGFRRNKHDTSPRLVVSALKNGYRYLTLLSRAADPSSREHAEVLSFLRENTARVIRIKEQAASEKASRVSTAPIEGRVTLLRKVSGEGEPPAYEPNVPPRPLSSFRSGVRKPPTLSATSGIPFLRFKKPQPRFLERVIRQKSQRRMKRLVKILELQEEGIEEAKQEDAWERLVAGMLAEQQGQHWDRGKKGGGGFEPTYKQTLEEAVQYLSVVAEEERHDLVARGKAMWKIVLEEQEMALKEEKERLMREGREDEEPRLRNWRRQIWDRRGRKAPMKKRLRMGGS
ncbi:hypothetical protein VTI74DRAFT_6747 [Chaetomium olivicolor]